MFRIPRLVAALAVAAGVPLAAAAGCDASSGSSTDTGSIELVANVSQAITAASVNKVTVSVSGSDFTPALSATATTSSSGSWQINVPNIPTGPNRTVHGDAFQGSTKIYTGDATNVTITKGVTNVVMLNLQGVTAPTTFNSNPPVVDSVVASTSVVAPGGAVTLTATAHDPDGDALTTTWTATNAQHQNAGTFSAGSSLTTNWTAPATPGVYHFTVSVRDTHTMTAGVSFDLLVQSAATGSAAVAVNFDAFPTVRGVTSSSGRLVTDGATTTLSVDASDDLGGSLSYSWGVSGCSGSFSAGGSPGTTTATSTTFTLGTLGQSTSCTFTVTATDSRSNQNTGTLTVPAGAGASPNEAPTLDVTSQSVTTGAPGSDVTFSVQAHDPEAKSLTFTWSSNASPSSLLLTGGQTNTATSSTVHLTLPSSCGQSVTVTATITDADGLATSHDFTVQSNGCP